MFLSEAHRYHAGNIAVSIDENVRTRIESEGFLWACQNDVNPRVVSNLIYDEYYRHHFGPMAKATPAWQEFQNQFDNPSIATHRRRLIRALIKEKGIIPDHGKPFDFEKRLSIVWLLRSMIERMISGSVISPVSRDGVIIKVMAKSTYMHNRTYTETKVFIFETGRSDARTVSFNIKVPPIRVDTEPCVDIGESPYKYRGENLLDFRAIPHWYHISRKISYDEKLLHRARVIGLSDKDEESMADYFWLNSTGDIDRASVKIDGDDDEIIALLTRAGGSIASRLTANKGWPKD